jgi:hypothetical protein
MKGILTEESSLLFSLPLSFPPEFTATLDGGAMEPFCPPSPETPPNEGDGGGNPRLTADRTIGLGPRPAVAAICAWACSERAAADRPELSDAALRGLAPIPPCGGGTEGSC